MRLMAYFYRVKIARVFLIASGALGLGDLWCLPAALAAPSWFGERQVVAVALPLSDAEIEVLKELMFSAVVSVEDAGNPSLTVGHKTAILRALPSKQLADLGLAGGEDTFLGKTALWRALAERDDAISLAALKGWVADSTLVDRHSLRNLADALLYRYVMGRHESELLSMVAQVLRKMAAFSANQPGASLAAVPVEMKVLVVMRLSQWCCSGEARDLITELAIIGPHTRAGTSLGLLTHRQKVVVGKLMQWVLGGGETVSAGRYLQYLEPARAKPAPEAQIITLDFSSAPRRQNSGAGSPKDGPAGAEICLLFRRDEGSGIPRGSDK